ncbi:MAG: dTDP-4-dehydrorhamnose reductase [Bacteroidales bacterium]|nr:dTDP-4-dehydrorhamnose reductase [Bacteroidales bacterium]MDD6732370.1 dTDP-4-dehydrorhamnose reductase [Bacteroidales bacterium]
MKNILVTGSNGQLGSELQSLAPAHDETCRFFFTDVAELDITDRQAVYSFVEQNRISVIVNCAAFTAVDKAESEPERCNLLNHIAPGYLAEAIASVGGTMIQISTDYVFDGTSCKPYKEEDITNPQTVYGRTKLAGEESVIRTCAGSMVIRTAWLYSTYGNNFVKTMLRLGKERDKLGVVADQIGTPTYAHDLAKAILTVIEKGIKPGVYHFTNEGTCSWYDFTKAIHRMEGIEDCEVSPIHTEDYPVPAKRPHYSVLDKTKIKQTYELDIRWWEDALKDCLKKL